MAEPDKRPVALEELLVSSLAQTDALAKLLIEKGLIDDWANPPDALSYVQNRGIQTPAILKTFQ
jgi:hypothetical protein